MIAAGQSTEEYCLNPPTLNPCALLATAKLSSVGLKTQPKERARKLRRLIILIPKLHSLNYLMQEPYKQTT
jgi:hypothetical protein